MVLPRFTRLGVLLLLCLLTILHPVRTEDDRISVLGRDVEERADHDWFHLQAYESNQRYHKSKASWITFSGGDAIVTEVFAEAAKFSIAGSLLMSDGQWVHLDFSNGYAVFKLEHSRPKKWWHWRRDHDGWLYMWGRHLGIGHGEGVPCISDDGFMFIEGDRHAPFKCRGVNLCPRQHPGPPPPRPPHHPYPPPPPTKTTPYHSHPTRPYTQPPNHTTKPHTPPYHTTPPYSWTHTSKTWGHTTSTWGTHHTTKTWGTTHSTPATTTKPTTTWGKPSTTTCGTTTTANPSSDPDPDMYVYPRQAIEFEGDEPVEE